MAIELPDPGNGIPEDKTGNDEWTNMKIVRENFRDPENAASRLVGVKKDQIPLAKKTRLAASNPDVSRAAVNDVDDLVGTDMTLVKNSDTNAPTSISGSAAHFVDPLQIEGNDRVWQFAYASHKPEIQFRMRVTAITGFSAWAKVYHTQNTTTDSNGFIKASSPVLQVHADKITGNFDGKKMGASFTKNDVGDYTITGTTGLALNGWYITLPEDINGNPKIAVELKEVDGVVSLKTYKRVFNMETFAFGPDLKNPIDIPEGRWVDLRFNDLPQDEVIDDGPTI